MKILVTFLTVVITNICVAQQPSANEWEPISHPNGGYSVQHSYISPHSSSSESQRDDRKLPIIRDDVESSASAIISPITQDIDTLQEFNKHNFIDDGSCAVDKYALDHEATIDYNTKFIKMEQFTLCLWARFVKHDGDHVLFTYAAHDEPREIQLWVANVNGSSFVSMAVRGHSLYRLNYPMAMKKWHHMCSSWNGKTGEWQLWISKERVGRGFYNRLVGHEIEPNGQAFTGGKSHNGPVAKSLHFEVTLLQLYKVALSAGKAHRNHKHHHVHKFNSFGEISTTTAAPPPVTSPQPINPLLANGQFPSRVKINLAGGQQPAPAIGQPPLPQPIVNTNFNVGQFHTGARHLQHQLIKNSFPGPNPPPSFISSSASLPPASPPRFASSAPQAPPSIPPRFASSFEQVAPPSSPPRFPSSEPASATVAPPSSLNFVQSSSRFPQSTVDFSDIKSPSAYTSFTSSSYNSFGSNPANVQFIEDSYPQSSPSSSRVKRSNLDSLVTKRDLVTLSDGRIVDDKSFDNEWYDGLAQFGDDFLKQEFTKNDHHLESEIKEHDKEPAELEVEASQNYCNFCLVEPFESALVLSWKDAVKGHGVLEAKASQYCGEF